METEYQHAFQQSLKNNLQIWLDYTEKYQTQPQKLDRERDNILKALYFSFQFNDSWTQTYALIRQISPYLERRGLWNAWEAILEKGIVAAQRANDVSGELHLATSLALALQRQSRYKEALSHYRQIIKRSKQIDDDFSRARACASLGYIYTEFGFWYRAEVLCVGALKIFNNLNDLSGAARAENDLGLLYTRQHRWDDAQRCLEEADRKWTLLDNQDGRISNLINLSNLYLETKKFDLATDVLDKALFLAQQTGEKVELGVILMNFGLAYQGLQNMDVAEAFTQRAEAIYRHYSNFSGLALAWVNLGLIYISQERWEDAEYYLESSLKMGREMKSPYLIIETHFGLAQYAIAQKDKTLALTQFEQIDKIVANNRMYSWRYASLRNTLVEMLENQERSAQ